MPATNLSLLRMTGLMTGGLLALTGGQAAETNPDTFPKFDNYLSLSAQGVAVDGHGAAFQARQWTSKNGAGGIEDFRYAKDLANDVTTTVDGHALFDISDYLAHCNVSKSEVGSFDAGYQQFRTYYDGVGGFFPLNNNWFTLPDANLHVDRSKLWAEANITLPNLPVFTLRYTDERRYGKKDSTIWGDTDFTGLPTGQTISQVRKLAPAYRQLGEHHQTLEGSAKLTVGNTTLQVRLLGDRVNNGDTLFMTRFPGEIKSPVGTNPNNQVAQWSQEGILADTFTAEAKVETVLSKQVTVHAGLSYQRLNSDFTGNRPLLTSTPTSAGAVVVTTYNFLNMAGTSQAKVYTGNVGLDWKPSKDFMLQVALRGEDNRTTSAGSFYTVALASGSTTVTAAPVLNHDSSRVKESVMMPTVNARYTGIKSVVLYASGTQRMTNGDERTTNPFSTATPSTSSLTFNDITEDHGNYTVGANWQATSQFSARAEGFYKDHQNKFIGYDVDLGTTYILGYKFTGVKLTGTLKPLPTLSFTSRYVGQTGKMQVTAQTFSAYDSMDAKSHSFGESVDWNPTTQFYLQGNANLVFNTISTIYPRAGVAASGLNANAILQNANNNYWNASALAGWIVDKRTDAQLQYTYYRADNYRPVLAYTTVPYGASAKEYTVTLGLKHKFSDRIVGSAKIGYFSSVNDTTGGFTNYRGPLAYVALTHAL